MEARESHPIRALAIAVATLWTLGTAALVLFVTGGGNLTFAGIPVDDARAVNALVPALVLGIVATVGCLAVEFVAPARTGQPTAR